LFKIEACEKINHPDGKYTGPGRNIVDIPRINPPKFGSGLIFEHNENIGRNRHLWIDTKQEIYS